MLIVRINDGVTEPFTALLDLPPEQRAQAATALGSVEVDPGQVDTVFLRLTPGRYGAADFLTQGTARLDAPCNGVLVRRLAGRPRPDAARYEFAPTRWSCSSGMGAVWQGTVHEQFGDGIISAINFKLDVQKVAYSRGRRARLHQPRRQVHLSTEALLRKISRRAR